MQDEINIIIVDDEKMWSDNLSSTLSELGFNVTGVATTFEEAVVLMNSTDFDIAMVDIHLNRKNSGIELGKMLYSVYKKPYLFITAGMNQHTVKEVVNAKPSAYLTKPVHRKSLVSNIHAALNNFNERISPEYNTLIAPTDRFFIKQGNKYKQLQWGNIAYLNAAGNYTVIFNSADGADYHLRSTLSRTISSIIPQHLQQDFVQINRAEAVHIGYVKEVIGEEVRTEYKTFTVTESYIPGLRAKMNLVL